MLFTFQTVVVVAILALFLPASAPVKAQSLSFMDIHPGAEGSDPAELAVAGGILFFAADDGTNGVELWKSDGTASGTVLVKNINPGGDSFPSELTAFNGMLYFAANGEGNDIGLWKSDGTADGTELVKGSLTAVEGLTVFDGALYFAAWGGSEGRELWKSDGTTAGTVLLKNTASGVEGIASPVELVPFGSAFYFSAPGANGSELWKSDGTTGGTVLLKEIHPNTSAGPNAFTPAGSALLFAATAPESGTELWKTDGTADGTVLVKDIDPGAFSAFSFPNEFAAFNGEVYFGANDGQNGIELWKSDGTTGGTVLLKDINPGEGDGIPLRFQVFDNALYFRADDGTSGVELWKTDGTTEGTVQVKNISPGFGSSFPTSLTPFADALYFQARGELWRTDGTTGGTVLVQDINPGGLSNPLGFTAFDGALYFAATNGTDGRELWKLGGASLPVELIAFTARLDDGSVALRWETASETNNAGFEVERRNSQTVAWTQIDFIEGAGTTSVPQIYRYVDSAVPFETQTLTYRLKQIDVGGAFEYSPEVEVTLTAPERLALEATFPNPFRGRTTIRYALPQAGPVRLAVYDVLGREVAVLVDEVHPAGRHEIAFDGRHLPSGLYLARLTGPGQAQTRRMMVVK